MGWGLLTYLILNDLGVGTMALKYISNTGNDPAYNNHNNIPGALQNIRSFKCMFIAVFLGRWTIQVDCPI